MANLEIMQKQQIDLENRKKQITADLLKDKEKELKELMWINMKWSMFFTCIFLFDIGVIVFCAFNWKAFIGIGWGWVFVGLGLFSWGFVNKKFFRKWRKVLRSTKIRIDGKEIKKEAEEEIKRLGWIRRIWFKIRTYQMWNALVDYEMYHEYVLEKVGHIKGKENERLMELKEEMIDIILSWKEDFQVTISESSSIPVTEEYLQTLTIEELYERYLIVGMNGLSNFVNGRSLTEKQPRI